MRTTAQEIGKQIRGNGYVEPIDVPRDGRPGSPPGSSQKPAKSKASSGRFQVLNQFVDESARLVSTTAAAVWFVLFRDTRSDGTAKVSHNQIAARLGISRRSAMRNVKQLIDAGLVQVVKRGNADNKEPSTYRALGLPHGKGN